MHTRDRSTSHPNDSDIGVRADTSSAGEGSRRAASTADDSLSLQAIHGSYVDRDGRHHEARPGAYVDTDGHDHKIAEVGSYVSADSRHYRPPTIGSYTRSEPPRPRPGRR